MKNEEQVWLKKKTGLVPEKWNYYNSLPFEYKIHFDLIDLKIRNLIYNTYLIKENLILVPRKKFQNSQN